MIQTAPPEFEALIAEYRGIDDQITDAEKIVKNLKEQQDAVERKIKDYMNGAGIKSAAASCGRCYFSEHWSAKVDGEKQQDFKKWLMESGNGHCLHNTFSANKVLELQDNGVALPEYVVIESHLRFNFRRA